MAILNVGDNAPDFTLATDSGKDFCLSDQIGNAVVLFFYPKDDTSGCTLEGTEFTRLKDEFAELGTIVVGISPDSVDDHCKFRDKHNLGVTLGADPEHLAIGPYGVWGEKLNYGKKYMGLIRTTFLIDSKGTIAQTWKVNGVEGHAAKVLEAARTLDSQ